MALLATALSACRSTRGLRQPQVASARVTGMHGLGLGLGTGPELARGAGAPEFALTRKVNVPIVRITPMNAGHSLPGGHGGCNVSMILPR